MFQKNRLFYEITGLILLITVVFAMACGDNSSGGAKDASSSTVDCTGDTTKDTSSDRCIPDPNKQKPVVSPQTPPLNLTVTRNDVLSSGYLDFTVQSDATSEREVTFYLLKSTDPVPANEPSFQKLLEVQWLDSTNEFLYTYFRTKVQKNRTNYVWFAHDNEGRFPLDENTDYDLYYYDHILKTRPSLLNTYTTQQRRSSTEIIRESPNLPASAVAILPYQSFVHFQIYISGRVTIQMLGNTINNINDGSSGSQIYNVNKIYEYTNVDYDLSSDFEIQFFNQINDSSVLGGSNRALYSFTPDSTSETPKEIEIEFY